MNNSKINKKNYMKMNRIKKNNRNNKLKMFNKNKNKNNKNNNKNKIILNKMI